MSIDMFSQFCDLWTTTKISPKSPRIVFCGYMTDRQGKFKMDFRGKCIYQRTCEERMKFQIFPDKIQNQDPKILSPALPLCQERDFWSDSYLVVPRAGSTGSVGVIVGLCHMIRALHIHGLPANHPRISAVSGQMRININWIWRIADWMWMPGAADVDWMRTLAGAVLHFCRGSQKNLRDRRL